jgi:hypothetical protein
MRVELLFAAQEVGEEAVLERVILARRDVVEDARVEDVSPGVDGVDFDFLGLRLFEEAADAPVLFGLDEPVGGRVLDGREDDGRHRPPRVVLADDGFEVEVGDDVAVEDDGRLAD